MLTVPQLIEKFAQDIRDSVKSEVVTMLALGVDRYSTVIQRVKDHDHLTRNRRARGGK